jgi:hypothetical protein
VNTEFCVRRQSNVGAGLLANAAPRFQLVKNL